MALRDALPVLFLSHGGGPSHLLDLSGTTSAPIDRNSPSAEFMRNLGPTIRQFTGDLPIKCILIISAHWEEPVFTVDYQPSTKPTKLVYDYYGFPDETYSPHLTYPCKSDLRVANRIINLLKRANIPIEKIDRGYDHGVFIPMKVAFPKLDFPIVQLSLKNNLNIHEHIQLGEILQPLRQEGVLIIGSGQMTHNLRELRQPRTTIEPKVIEFTNWFNKFLSSTTSQNYVNQRAILSEIGAHAPHFFFNHPRPEHFIPMAVVFGAAFAPKEYPPDCDEDGEELPPPPDPAPRAFRLYHEIVLGSMAVDSYIMF
jgi:aromatic ring-opening dioxygenase catalytic subunit (LigB family)